MNRTSFFFFGLVKDARQPIDVTKILDSRLLWSVMCFIVARQLVESSSKSMVSLNSLLHERNK